MEVKEWIKNLTEEYEGFKKEMHESDVSCVYRSYEKIMLYETVFSYLIATEDDVYLGLTIKDVYDYYIENDIYDVALTDNDQLIKLLDWTYEDKKRRNLYINYENEYEDFKKEMLSMPQEKMFFEYEKIRFYNIINLYIQNTEYYEVADYMKNKTIAELYQKAKESSYTYNLNNTKRIRNFLKEIQ